MLRVRVVLCRSSVRLQSLTALIEPETPLVNSSMSVGRALLCLCCKGMQMWFRCVLQACPCTQAAICSADNLWLTDQDCKLKFNQPGNGHFFHRGTPIPAPNCPTPSCFAAAAVAAVAAVAAAAAADVAAAVCFCFLVS